MKEDGKIPTMIIIRSKQYNIDDIMRCFFSLNTLSEVLRDFFLPRFTSKSCPGTWILSLILQISLLCVLCSLVAFSSINTFNSILIMISCNFYWVIMSHELSHRWFFEGTHPSHVQWSSLRINWKNFVISSFKHN